MPALLPTVLTVAHLVLTAQHVPTLNVAPSCRAAADTAIRQDKQGTSSCLQDERQARAKLQKQWRTFTRAERAHCRQLTTLGGPPSYVELLTCLQIAKAARALPTDKEMGGRLAR
jgi:hypothetical protein